MKILPFLALILAFSTVIKAQSESMVEKCGTMHLHANQHFNTISNVENQFESWLEGRIQDRRIERAAFRTAEEPYLIPVVVHIIHRGESLGESANIPTEQVIRQIEILNEDYRMRNADTVNTFEPFKSLATDTEIEFHLAVRDPEGLPTTGIVRAQGEKSSYGTSDADLLSKVSYWPSDQYLNIWVTNLNSGLLGYAQFPTSNLPGLDIDRNSDPLTDGVVIDFEYFGQGFNTDDFSQGRTASHEIGHYLGLRHIWGDGGCNRDDFCSDTPTKETSTSGCPSEPSLSCNTLDMNQNFMDYTDDLCMSLFTGCQKERMRAVLENSPRRQSLLSSPALTPVTLVQNDLGIRKLETLYSNSCGLTLAPLLEVRNYGDNNISTASIELRIDSERIEILSLNFADLSPGETELVSFSDYALDQEGEFSVAFEITQVNGQQDQKPSDNLYSEDLYTTLPASGDLLTDFESTSLWSFDESSAISIENAPNTTSNNMAATFNFFESEQDLGTINILESPVIRINPLSSPKLTFSYAYQHPPGNHVDALFVLVSTDCGLTYLAENAVFSGFGSGLNTSNNVDPGARFQPTNADEWRTFSVNLDKFRDDQYVRIAFLGQNGGGNNLYIDDILVNAGPSPEIDLAIQALEQFPVVSCTEDTEGLVSVINSGTATIVGFQLDYQLDGIDQAQVSFPGIVLESGQSTSVPIDIMGLTKNTISEITIAVAPIAGADDVILNNTASAFIVQSSEELLLPYRDETSSDQAQWQSYNENGFASWVSRPDFYQMPLAENPNLGENFWLIGPRLDLVNIKELSLGFEYAHAKRDGASEELLVFADLNCDGRFEEQVFRRSGEALSTADFAENWIPSEAEDWESGFVDLSELLGAYQNIRLAFMAKNSSGNDIFLRNIALYENDREPIIIESQYQIYPNPAVRNINIKFNLPEKTPVTLSLIDMQGRIIWQQLFDETLNQTYELQTASENSGMYLLRISTPTFNSTERILIWH